MSIFHQQSQASAAKGSQQGHAYRWGRPPPIRQDDDDGGALHSSALIACAERHPPTILTSGLLDPSRLIAFAALALKKRGLSFISLKSEALSHGN